MSKQSQSRMFEQRAKRVSEFLSSAVANQQLRSQLTQVQTPNQCVEIAADYGHQIKLADIAIFLTFYKSDPECVNTYDLTGDSLYVANWGNFPMGSLMGLFEEHGLVRPFCNLDSRKKNHTLFGISTDINRKQWRGQKRTYQFRECFLPRGYFSR